jgi:serine/threonine protein kinase
MDRNIDCIENYELFERLDCGAFGAVHRAKKRIDQQDVAIKILHRHDVDETAKMAFKREVDLLLRLDHSFITRIVSYFVHEGAFHIVLIFESGGSLDSAVKRYKGPLPMPLVARLFSETAEALHYLHNLPEPVIHRDLKLTNVLLSEKGHVRVADFGLSRPGPVGGMSESASVAGSTKYMAPEMLRGKFLFSRVKNDTRVDVWSLGVILWELLGGDTKIVSGLNALTLDSGECWVNTAWVPPEFPVTGSHADMTTVARWLLTADPFRRPDMHAVLCSPEVQRIRAEAEQVTPSMISMLLEAPRSGSHDHRRDHDSYGDLPPAPDPIGPVVDLARKPSPTPGALSSAASASPSALRGMQHASTVSATRPVAAESDLRQAGHVVAVGHGAAAAADAAQNPRCIAALLSGPAVHDVTVFSTACEYVIVFLGGRGRFNLDQRMAAIQQDGSTLEARTEAVLEAGVPGALISAMREHVGSVDAAEIACYALINIAALLPGKTAAIEVGAIPFLVAALRAHVRSPEVAENSCRALANVSFVDAGKLAAIDAGAPAAIAAAMHVHASNSEVCKQGCWALERIFYFQVPDYSDVLPAILEALRNHHEDVDTLSRGVRALKSVTRARAGKLSAVSHGVPRVVVGAMHKHVANADVAKAGCQTLRQIALLRDGMTAVIEARGLEAVDAAISFHETPGSELNSESVLYAGNAARRLLLSSSIHDVNCIGTSVVSETDSQAHARARDF